LQESPFAKDYFGQTVLNPLGLAVVLISGLAVLLLPRRFALWPFALVACFVAPAQRVVVFSLNFDLLRIMILVGTVRVLARREWNMFKWTTMDHMVLAWSAYAIIATLFVFGSADALKYKLGMMYDVIGMYFVTRLVVRDWSDLTSLVRCFALLSIPVLLAFLVENQTGRNLFAAFGGVPEITVVRDERLRCQGAFAHPILAGVFWISLLPLFVVEWWHRGLRRPLIVAASFCAVLIMVLCASSTPVLGLVFATGGAILFPLRLSMRWIRWGLLLLTVGLHLSMQKPVWHLLARLTIVGGSTSYHRYAVIDEAIKHVNEWCLIGSSIGTAHWGYGMEDCTNMYVVWGVHGGLGLVALFIALITIGFRDVGRMVKDWSRDRGTVVLVWGLGLSFLVHVVSFMGVTYFGQINMLWHIDLATIASLSTLPLAVPCSMEVSKALVPATSRIGQSELLWKRPFVPIRDSL
jgi:hypothetical protein